MGIAVDTVVFAIKTAGLGIPFLYGAGIEVVYFLIFLGVAALALSYVKRKRFTARPVFASVDLWVACLAAFVAVAVTLYFEKYPYFPYFNPDFLTHTVQATGLIPGEITSVPKLLVYGAGDYQLAMAVLVAGGVPLFTVRHTMNILAVLSPFLVYAVAKRLFARARAALLTTAVFALSGAIWAPLVLYDGLYANFVGILLEIVLIVAFLDLSSDYRSRGVWLSSLTILVAAYFSHYTVVSILGGFLFFSLLAGLLRKPSSRGYLLASAVFLAPGALGALLFRRTLHDILDISYTVYARTPYTTYLSHLLSPIPSVAYLASDFSNDYGFVALFALFAVALYSAYRSRHLPPFLMAAWFLGLLAVTPENAGAWRFGFEALVPVILLAGYGFDSLLSYAPSLIPVKKAKPGPPPSSAVRRGAMVAVCLILLVPTAYPGWAFTVLRNATTGTQQEAQVQGNILQAMTWLRQNAPPTSLILSVTDPRFIFTRTVINMISSDHFSLSPTAALSFARGHRDNYVVVTRYDVDVGNGTVIFDAPNLPWYTYPGTPGLTLVYQNSDVMIFAVSRPG